MAFRKAPYLRMFKAVWRLFRGNYATPGNSAHKLCLKLTTLKDEKRKKNTQRNLQG